MKSFLYSENVNKTNIFRSNEYIEANKLLNSAVSPGLEILHQKILDSINERNDVYKESFKLCLIVFIGFAVLITLFMWIPYLQSQKASVFFCNFGN